MNIKLLQTLRNYNKDNFIKDIIAGIIIMAVSIPISMGYAQIAGLPAVYGLYGSVFPILVFGLFSTSPQFIFGVDAAPAALVGSALLTLNIEAGSDKAMAAVPVMTFFVALWLLAFYFMKAGKLVNYISAPVMGGFITGICTTIILMQIPKVMGGTSGTGEFFQLAEHIYKTVLNINMPSVIMGVIALIILLASKKIIPKFPMAVVLMFAGTILTISLPIKEWGIKTLNAVEPGLPKWSIPDFSAIPIQQTITISLSVAVVIMAETLLAENSFAQKNNYRINDNQEILAFSVGNFMAAFTGCCPINGSVSRTAMGEQYQAKTQLTGIVAGLSMIVLLLCGTGFIGYLPVPVLTAIVISALMDVVETHLAVRLFKVSRTEFYIFMAAGFSVLCLGTIYGVIIGILLSFVAVILKATNPPRSFRGMIPGRDAYFDLSKNRFAYPIKGVVIYRFSENLFFANIKIFQEDIENSIRKDTRVVIVDASAINSIDVTAADRLDAISASLKKRGIRFYLTEHSTQINDQLRQFGIGHMIKDGMVRRTILAALHDAGIEAPYELDVPKEDETKLLRRSIAFLPAEEENTLEEFAWAFGDDAVKEIEESVHHIIEQLHQIPDIQRLSEEGLEELLDNWHGLGLLDEDELLRRIELHMDELPEELTSDRRLILQFLEKRRGKLKEKILSEHPEVLERLEQRRKKLEERLEKQNPEAVQKWKHWKEEHLKD